MMPQENVFLAAMMKSGGIHISNCLGALLKWRSSSLGSWTGTGVTEQDINPHVAWTVLEMGSFVFHMHTRGWSHNAKMLANFGVKPIVLIRNAADVIQSVMDNLQMDHQKGLDTKMLPGVYVPKDFDLMSREQRELFLVQNLGPWLLSFYVSWKRQTDVPVLWVNYEEHFRDQVASFRRMLNWLELGQELPDEALKQIASTRPFNFNVGVSGRGLNLSDQALTALVDLIMSWGPEWSSRLLADLWIDGSGDRQTSSQPKPGLRMSQSWRGELQPWEGSTSSTTTINGGHS